jgi:hypothetical protein
MAGGLESSLQTFGVQGSTSFENTPPNREMVKKDA